MDCHCHSNDRKFVCIRECRGGGGIEDAEGSGKTSGFCKRTDNEIVEDKRKFKKLEMKRNHTRFLQTSIVTLQAWRGNCDIQILIYESEPHYPDCEEIAQVTDYIVGYATKGNVTLKVEKDIMKDIIKQ